MSPLALSKAKEHPCMAPWVHQRGAQHAWQELLATDSHSRFLSSGKGGLKGKERQARAMQRRHRNNSARLSSSLPVFTKHVNSLKRVGCQKPEKKEVFGKVSGGHLGCRPLTRFVSYLLQFHLHRHLQMLLTEAATWSSGRRCAVLPSLFLEPLFSLVSQSETKADKTKTY